MCITGLLEIISIPVIPSGIDPGGLEFKGSSMSSFQEHGGTDVS
jgi:hypothetical protein